MTYFVASPNAATPANSARSWVPQGSFAGCPTTRRMSATPLPVSMALAGHTMAPLWRYVMATSMTAHVTMAARIWNTVTWKPRPTWPRTWMDRRTVATCSRGSRMLGRTTGISRLPKATAWAAISGCALVNAGGCRAWETRNTDPSLVRSLALVLLADIRMDRDCVPDVAKSLDEPGSAIWLLGPQRCADGVSDLPGRAGIHVDDEVCEGRVGRRASRGTSGDPLEVGRLDASSLAPSDTCLEGLGSRSEPDHSGVPAQEPGRLQVVL